MYETVIGQYAHLYASEDEYYEATFEPKKATVEAPRIEEPLWFKKDGSSIRVQNMSHQHCKNALALLQRQGKSSLPIAEALQQRIAEDLGAV